MINQAILVAGSVLQHDYRRFRPSTAGREIIVSRKRFESVGREKIFDRNAYENDFPSNLRTKAENLPRHESIYETFPFIWTKFVEFRSEKIKAPKADVTDVEMEVQRRGTIFFSFWFQFIHEFLSSKFDDWLSFLMLTSKASSKFAGLSNSNERKNKNCEWIRKLNLVLIHELKFEISGSCFLYWAKIFSGKLSFVIFCKYFL